MLLVLLISGGCGLWWFLRLRILLILLNSRGFKPLMLLALLMYRGVWPLMVPEASDSSESSDV